MKTIPIEVKYCLISIDMHENYSVINCNKVIPPIADTLKNIYLINIFLLDSNQNSYFFMYHLLISSDST